MRRSGSRWEGVIVGGRGGQMNEYSVVSSSSGLKQFQ